MNFSLLLALRFLQGAAYERTLSTMIRICFFSIMLGTGSLTLIASIMKGFESATHKKLQGVHSDLVISTDDGSIDYPKLTELIAKDYSHTIRASSPSSVHHIMLQAETSTGRDPYRTIETTICLLKSIDPHLEPLVSSLGTMITASSGIPFENLIDDTVFIGKTLASRMNVEIGSPLTLLYQPDETNNSTQLKKKLVTVVGLYNTGIHDYDDQIVIASHKLVNQLYSERITHVALSLHEDVNIPQLKQELTDKLKLDVYSWKDLYPSLVSALTLEKYAMWIILLLVTLVASLTIVSLLFMYTTHKRTDIALLKSMGMEDHQLRHMLLWIASLVTFCATTCGIILAACGTWLLNAYPFISLPDVYFVSKLPATLTLSIVLAVYAVALFVSLCAGMFPNSAMKTMRVASTLKGIGL